MDYAGRYEVFDPNLIKTYPVRSRTNKVTLSDVIVPERILERTYDVGLQADHIRDLAGSIVEASRNGRAVIWFTGAHLIKNGLGPIVIDLAKRKVISLVATNGAGIIHDFELALFGETSEHVPDALPAGLFGMAFELSFINGALAVANERRLGYGEGIGRMICDQAFCDDVATRLGCTEPIVFKYPQISVTATCYELGIPLTCHVGIGTDVIDQHPNFDGCAKGGCSGRDLLIFTNEVPKLAQGGVFINVGSAVTGPEVLLKAVSMVGNVGRPPTGLITADFDLKDYRREVMSDETSMHYYYRDHKSVVTRVPEAFGGRGFYIQGDQRQTLPRLYQEIITLL
jgi:hypothetical protein